MLMKVWSKKYSFPNRVSFENLLQLFSFRLLIIFLIQYLNSKANNKITQKIHLNQLKLKWQQKFCSKKISSKCKTEENESILLFVDLTKNELTKDFANKYNNSAMKSNANNNSSSSSSLSPVHTSVDIVLNNEWRTVKQIGLNPFS